MGHVQVSVLGPPRVAVLAGDSGIRRELGRPKAIALIAYLAIEGRPAPRTELLHVLWPDRPERAARAALSQVIHTVRRFAAPIDPFLAAGDQVALDSTVVCSDLAEFRSQLSAASVNHLLSYIDTELMQGFLIAEPDTFTEWLEARRREFSLELTDIGWRAAERASSAGEALRILDHVAKLRPFDEALLRRRMELLERISDFGSAIHLYEAFRQNLADALGTRPSPETVRLASRLLQAGDTSTERTETVAPAGEGNDPGSATSDRRPGSRALQLIATATAVVLLVLAGFWLTSAGEADDRGPVELSIGDL
jgi:DNA-binding SARP family transcriptional activator